MCDVDHIISIARFLKINPGQIELNKDNVLVRTYKDETYTGYSTIMSGLVRESKIPDIDRETEALYSQWFSYAKVFIDPAFSDKPTSHAMLTEINTYLRDNTFLVGQSITLADMAVFLAVAPIIDGLHVNDKERLVHLSRWFSHMQLSTRLRGNKKPVSFATLQLSAFEVASGH